MKALKVVNNNIFDLNTSINELGELKAQLEPLEERCDILKKTVKTHIVDNKLYEIDKKGNKVYTNGRYVVQMVITKKMIPDAAKVFKLVSFLDFLKLCTISVTKLKDKIGKDKVQAISDIELSDRFSIKAAK